MDPSQTAFFQAEKDEKEKGMLSYVFLLGIERLSISLQGLEHWDKDREGTD